MEIVSAGPAGPAGAASAASRAPSAPGARFPGGFPAACTDVNVLASSSGVLGPFTESGILQGDRAPFPYETDNPAPLVFPNGSTWVMVRQQQRREGGAVRG